MDKYEQRYVILFFWRKKTQPKDIFNELKEVYGENSLKLRCIQKWCQRFDEGKEDVFDEVRGGRPKNNHLIPKISKIIESNPSISTTKLAYKLQSSKETVKRILTEELQMKKVNLKWIPNKLNEEIKKKRMKISKILLNNLNGLKKRERSLIFTQDETWIYFENPNEFQWINEGNERPKKKRKIISSKKTMISVVWSTSGFHSIVKLEKKEKFNRDFFKNEVLGDLKKKIEIKRPKLKFSGIKLHMDNARPHCIDDYLAEIDLERLPHPPYSPDLAPSDFFLFGYLKKLLEGLFFENDEDLFKKVCQILHSIKRETLESVYDEWIKRLELCLEKKGDYL